MLRDLGFFFEGVLAGQGVGIVAWMGNWAVGSQIYLLLYMKVGGQKYGGYFRFVFLDFLALGSIPVPLVSETCSGLFRDREQEQQL